MNRSISTTLTIACALLATTSLAAGAGGLSRLTIERQVQPRDDFNGLEVTLPPGLNTVDTVSTVSAPMLAQVRTPSELKSTTTTQPEEARLAGSPSPPILESPPPNQALSSPRVIFEWRAGHGQPVPTRYELCVAVVGSLCSTGSNAMVYRWIEDAARIAPPPGSAPTTGTPITGTRFEIQLPPGFQTKPLEWLVRACAPGPLKSVTGGPPPILCTRSARRRFVWEFSPPNLSAVSQYQSPFRPVFDWSTVPAAESYLFCISKPGVACPSNPTASSETTVIATDRFTTSYVPPNDQVLGRFAGQTMHWSAAACRVASGCIYQQQVQEIAFRTPEPTPLTCETTASGILIRNGSYAAQISRDAVRMSVSRLQPNGTIDSIAFSGDGIGLGFDAPLPVSVTDTQLSDVQVTVDKCFSFYARVSVAGRLVFPNLASFVLKRTYEFTRSANIYVQLELELERAFGPVRVLPVDSARVWSFSWSFLTDPRTKVLTTTSDLFVQVPDGPLGGLDSGLIGHHVECDEECLKVRLAGANSLTRTNEGWARFILSDQKLADGHAIVLLRNRALLANSVIAIHSPDPEGPLNYSVYPFDLYQFYPTFGLRSTTKDRDGKVVAYHFNKWNDYQPAMENQSPIDRAQRNRQTEDALIRYTMFLTERLALDQGWWKHYAWKSSSKEIETQYLRGGRFTTNSRSFPGLAYTWAHLTMRQTPAGWIRVPSDADVIYHELQKTYSYYTYSDPAPNFADYTTSGTQFQYLAYSVQERERWGGAEPPRRVINSHGTALHFAWLMKEASSLFGDSDRARQWDDVVTQFHRGSKELFQSVYPGQDPTNPALTYRGLIGYSPFQREVKMDYQSWTFAGVAAGYQSAEEFEPEFADVVERVSRFDYNPFDAVSESAPQTNLRREAFSSVSGSARIRPARRIPGRNLYPTISD